MLFPHPLSHPGCKLTVQDVGSTCTIFTQEFERLLMGNIINKFGKTEGPRTTDGILLRRPDLAMGFANAEYPESVKKWHDLQTSTRRAICRHNGVFGPHVRHRIRDARLWLTPVAELEPGIVSMVNADSGRGICRANTDGTLGQT